MPIEVSAPVQREREQRAKEADQANIKLAELQRLYRESPEMKIQRDRDALERLKNDPFHMDKVIGGNAHARNEQALLAAKISDAASAEEARRLDIALGKTKPAEQPAARVTYGSQIPAEDHAAAVKSLLDNGVRPEMVETFLRTGHGDDPGGTEVEHAMAAEWERRLMADPEVQKKFLAGDPELLKQFRYFGMYRADRRKEPSE